MIVYQAITTKYFGPGNVKGSRVKARADAGSFTLHWDNALNPYDNHQKAAAALAQKMGWPGTYYGGAVGDGYVFVAKTDEYFEIEPALSQAAKGE